MSHLAPRSQWVAVMFLAAVIFAVLLVRLYLKDLPPSDVPSVVLIVAVEGDIERPGRDSPRTTGPRLVLRARFGIDQRGDDACGSSLGTGRKAERQ